MTAPAKAASAEAERAARIDLAAAYRLAVRFGLNEGIDNHLTLLLPGHADRFLLAPFGLHWDEVRASDLLVVHCDGGVLSGEGPVEDTAFFIHAPIHQATGAAAVLHTHSPYSTALSLLEHPELLMASQNAIGFHQGMAVYDYNGLALDRSEGERMVAALGQRPVLLLRNHGVLTTGRSVAEAFNHLYFFERAAQVQLLAQASGQPLRMVAPAVVTATAAQYLASDAVGNARRVDLHFAALKRLLDRDGSDYAR